MRVSYQKEINDTLTLAKKIEESGCVNDQTVLVCCAPDLSSLTCQIVNHMVGPSLNDMIWMEMSSPYSPQILNRCTGEYEMWDKYVVNYVSLLDKNYNYLFISGVTYHGKDIARVAQCMRAKDIKASYASVYVGEGSVFKPDFSVEIVDKVEYEWQRK